MGILSEREVLIKRCGKSLLWSPALHAFRKITAASAAAQKLGLKVKQMDVVMGILSEREVLIKRCGKSLLWSPALHAFHTLSQVWGIASLQPRRNGDSVAIAAHV